MKQLTLLKTCFFLFFLSLIFLNTSCAPVFSEMQSAATVGEGNKDVTASFSSVSWNDENGNEHFQNHVDIQASYGLTDQVDFRMRFAHVFTEGEEGFNILGGGPKFSIVPKKFSFYLPVGFAFGGGIESGSTWQIHPTLLGTIPVSEKFEINPSTKMLIPFDEGDNTLAFNLGLGIMLPNGFTLRPEYGILVNPGEEGYFTHFSVGMTYNPFVKASDDKPTFIK